MPSMMASYACRVGGGRAGSPSSVRSIKRLVRLSRKPLSFVAPPLESSSEGHVFDVISLQGVGSLRAGGHCWHNILEIQVRPLFQCSCIICLMNCNLLIVMVLFLMVMGLRLGEQHDHRIPEQKRGRQQKMQGNEKSFRGKDLTWSWAKSWVETKNRGLKMA